jgi:hypothetical protein
MTKLLINPPPQNGKCEQCGKHTSELKPFESDNNSDGALLMKTFRSMDENLDITAESIDLYNKIQDEYKYDETTKTDNIKELELKYSPELVDVSFQFGQLQGTVYASWECRDCIIK